jgi:SAM-dependent methyltransferase
MNADSCPVCGKHSYDQLFQSRSFPIGRCEECGLVRTLGVDDQDGVQTYPHFDQRETAVMKLMRLALAPFLFERASVVESLRPSERGRLLDVGCGSGAFARTMSKRGYDVVGVEPFSLGRPVEEPGLRLVRAPLERVRSELGRFDVITMWHVLEHLTDPKGGLADVASLLNDDGVLLVSVPNFTSWQSRVFKGGWFHLDPPRHLTHFDRATLFSLLESADFEIFTERTFHFEYGPVGWLQSALNRVTRPNFLFEFVKDRGALAGVPVHETALNLLVSGATVAALAPAALVVEGLAARGGSGGVLTVAARRRPTASRR